MSLQKMGLVVLVGLALSNPTKADELKAVITNSLTMPMLQLGASGSPSGGLLMDLTQAIATQMGASHKINLFDRGRIAAILDNGSADIVCYAMPEWWGENAAKVDWTVGFIPSSDIIAFPKGATVAKTVSDLEGKTIATVANYAYPELDPLFNAGKITKKPMAGQSHIYPAIEKKMVDAGISTDIEYNYYVKSKNKADQFTDKPFFLNKQKVKCAVSKKSVLGVAKINDAIKALEKAGKVDAIMAKYR